MTLDEIDKTGLIREAYRIEGITGPECRSIFMDWALNLSPDVPPRDAISLLLETYGGENAAHPMTAVLREGLAAPASPKRRGGRSARVRS